MTRKTLSAVLPVLSVLVPLLSASSVRADGDTICVDPAAFATDTAQYYLNCADAISEPAEIGRCAGQINNGAPGPRQLVYQDLAADFKGGTVCAGLNLPCLPKADFLAKVKASVASHCQKPQEGANAQKPVSQSQIAANQAASKQRAAQTGKAAANAAKPAKGALANADLAYDGSARSANRAQPNAAGVQMAGVGLVGSVASGLEGGAVVQTLKVVGKPETLIQTNKYLYEVGKNAEGWNQVLKYDLVEGAHEFPQIVTKNVDGKAALQWVTRSPEATGLRTITASEESGLFARWFGTQAAEIVVPEVAAGAAGAAETAEGSSLIGMGARLAAGSVPVDETPIGWGMLAVGGLLVTIGGVMYWRHLKKSNS